MRRGEDRDLRVRRPALQHQGARLRANRVFERVRKILTMGEPPCVDMSDRVLIHTPVVTPTGGA